MSAISFSSLTSGLPNLALFRVENERILAISEKVKEIACSPAFQLAIGCSLGCLTSSYITWPLANKILDPFNMAAVLLDTRPFPGFNLKTTALLLKAGVFGPIVEEILFRGVLQDKLISFFESLYQSQGLSDCDANRFARVTSVFSTSILFGLVHFWSFVTGQNGFSGAVHRVVAMTSWV